MTPLQNESLNGGGTLFVNKHPDLRVRVVHGNTLTAAVILSEIPANVTEVFLTGATSKLGRAIALYLCRKRVRVLVSSSPSSFTAKKRAPSSTSSPLFLTDANSLHRTIPKDPKGSPSGVPGVPRSGHQVSSRAELQGNVRSCRSHAGGLQTPH